MDPEPEAPEEGVPPADGDGATSLLGVLAAKEWELAEMVATVLTATPNLSSSAPDDPERGSDRQLPLAKLAFEYSEGDGGLVWPNGQSVRVLEAAVCGGWCWVQACGAAEEEGPAVGAEGATPPPPPAVVGTVTVDRQQGYVPLSRLVAGVLDEAAAADGPGPDPGSEDGDDGEDDRVIDLMGMGFNKRACMAALEAAAGSMEQAADILIGQGESAMAGYGDDDDEDEDDDDDDDDDDGGDEDDDDDDDDGGDEDRGDGEEEGEEEEPPPDLPESAPPTARARAIARSCSLTASDEAGRSAVEVIHGLTFP
jgi:hypothetical protein